MTSSSFFLAPSAADKLSLIHVLTNTRGLNSAFCYREEFPKKKHFSSLKLQHFPFYLIAHCLQLWTVPCKVVRKNSAPENSSSILCSESRKLKGTPRFSVGHFELTLDRLEINQWKVTGSICQSKARKSGPRGSFSRGIWSERDPVWICVLREKGDKWWRHDATFRVSFHWTSSSSSLMMPSRLATDLTELMTSSCTKLKLMASSAMPKSR